MIVFISYDKTLLDLEQHLKPTHATYGAHDLVSDSYHADAI